MAQQPNYFQGMNNEPGPFTQMFMQQLATPPPAQQNTGYASTWGNVLSGVGGVLSGIEQEKKERYVRERSEREQGMDSYWRYIQMAVLSNPNLTDEAKSAALEQAAEHTFGHIAEEVKSTPKGGFGSQVKDALSQMTGGKLPKVKPFNPLEEIGRTTTILSNPEFQRKHWVEWGNTKAAAVKAELKQKYGDNYEPAFLNAALAETYATLAEKLGPEYAQRFQALQLSSVIPPGQAFEGEMNRKMLNYIRQNGGLAGTAAAPPAARGEAAPTEQQPQVLMVPSATDISAPLFPERQSPIRRGLEQLLPSPVQSPAVLYNQAGGTSPQTVRPADTATETSGMPYWWENELTKRGIIPKRETDLVAKPKGSEEVINVERLGSVIVYPGTSTPIPNQGNYTLFKQGTYSGASTGAAGKVIVYASTEQGKPPQPWIVDKSTGIGVPAMADGQPLIGGEPNQIIETPEGYRVVPRSTAVAGGGAVPGTAPSAGFTLDNQVDAVVQQAVSSVVRDRFGNPNYVIAQRNVDSMDLSDAIKTKVKEKLAQSFAKLIGPVQMTQNSQARGRTPAPKPTTGVTVVPAATPPATSARKFRLPE